MNSPQNTGDLIRLEEPQSHSQEVNESGAVSKIDDQNSAPQLNPSLSALPQLPRPISMTDDQLGAHKWKNRAVLKSLMRRPELIKGLVRQRSVVMIYGKSGAGKSFTGADLALCIKTGKPWAGCGVEQGEVLYLPSEGTDGLEDRLEAWFRYFDPEPDDVEFWYDDAMFDLSNQADVLDLIKCTKAQMVSLNHPLRAIFIDVLAGYLGEVDENSSSGMNLVMKNLRFIAKELDLTVFIVHHSGWGATGRERGSSSIRGACDTVLSVTQTEDDKICVRVEKQKSGPARIEYGFEKHVVEVEDERQSLVLVPTSLERSVERQPSRKPFDNWVLSTVSANDNAMPKAKLREEFLPVYIRSRASSEHFDSSKAPESSKRALNRCLQGLVDAGLVIVDEETVTHCATSP